MTTNTTFRPWAWGLLALVSFVDFSPVDIPVPGRAGFFWAGAVTLGFVLIKPRALLTRVRASPVLTVAMALFIGSRFASAFFSENVYIAMSDALRASLIMTVLLLAIGLDKDSRRRVGQAGLLVLFTLLVCWLLSAAGLIDGFEHRPGHSLVKDGWPRLKAWSAHPMACGLLGLQALVLSQLSPDSEARRLGIMIGVPAVIATLSFATLALPLFLMSYLSPRYLRVPVAVTISLGALALLWFHPLTVDVGGEPLIQREVPAAWISHEHAAEHMPLVTVTAGPLFIKGFGTGYWHLSKNAVACFSEHYLVGTGANQVSQACPLFTMGTHGDWSIPSSSHNAWAGAFAEQGTVGILTSILLVFALWTSTRWRGGPREFWFLCGFGLLGFGGASPLSIPIALTLACSLIFHSQSGNESI